MTSSEIRKTFLDFFKSKQHEIVPSAPMVIKGDPTLMFTNAGMNQFKDWFLGNQPAKFTRVADTQKCLRVSGKHNDLEEVGVDTYHHTMFEMLGNWSFGDYFKKEAIEWSWQLLTSVYRIPVDRLYVTVFEGDAKEQLAFDSDSYENWKKWIAEDRILMGNKKDNFWEMGDTGPCGPCSEIHVDIRMDEERKNIDGKTLVNAGHPRVIEIWNNVFMEFNRKADGSLEKLPALHVDTGMGFERLCMVLQGVQSNYDTDVFQPLIQFIASNSKIKYGAELKASGISTSPAAEQVEKTDIAMRVMADHIRAISFAIADGQLPSNNKAGYVIRRILRRAVRYQFAVLNIKEPFMHKLVPILAQQLADVFPELKEQQEFIAKVIYEEEHAFLRTLELGIKKFEAYSNKMIEGSFAFELYDTYGFPIDLTQLMAREKGLEVDMDGFVKCMEQQKMRSRNATQIDTDDWVQVNDDAATRFLGYEYTDCDLNIIRYRKIKTKNKEQYQLVFDQTPFYAESGGQVGDTGFIENANERIFITDTQKENNLIVHFAEKLPENISAPFHASVDQPKRKRITGNHSATHLMHAALRKILGSHVAQKGSLVNDELTRFDFSHFAKVSADELARIENMVNEKIRENILLDEKRDVPINEAKAMGAMALFGEKYGDNVRVITFDKNFSVELCGGTHVKATGEIGVFKIISESSVAAGVRRIEAITSEVAENYFKQKIQTLDQINEILKNPKDIVKGLQGLLDENQKLKQQLESMLQLKANDIKQKLEQSIESINGINFIGQQIELDSADMVKNLSFDLKNKIENLMMILGVIIEDKPMLSLIISERLVKDKNLDASKIIRELAKEIHGGGGGQPFYATAGGKQAGGIKSAIEKARSFVV